MSSLWENSRIRDNNCFYNYKTLSDFCMRLDPGGVSRPSWGARRMQDRFATIKKNRCYVYTVPEPAPMHSYRGVFATRGLYTSVSEFIHIHIVWADARRVLDPAVYGMGGP